MCVEIKKWGVGFCFFEKGRPKKYAFKNFFKIKKKNTKKAEKILDKYFEMRYYIQALV